MLSAILGIGLHMIGHEEHSAGYDDGDYRYRVGERPPMPQAVEPVQKLSCKKVRLAANDFYAARILLEVLGLRYQWVFWNFPGRSPICLQF